MVLRTRREPLSLLSFAGFEVCPKAVAETAADAAMKTVMRSIFTMFDDNMKPDVPLGAGRFEYKGCQMVDVRERDVVPGQSTDTGRVRGGRSGWGEVMRPYFLRNFG